MQKITPFLWFDKEASEAAKFYTSIFPNSKIERKEIMKDTPSGTVEILTINLFNQEFTLMSAGPYFKFNPSISFTINCDSIKEVDETWKHLSKGGKVLMELDKYPFNERYGWLQDKYGVSWQIIFRKDKQKIIPSFLFVQKNNGKVMEAIKFYISIFDKSKLIESEKYKPGEGDTVGNIKYARFSLENQDFIAMESGLNHNFSFNEAVSFVIECKDQKEVDYYWNKLSADKKSEQCGWLKDKYGVSWQVVPKQLNELMKKDKSGRVVQEMLKMKKIIVADLEKAYKG